MKLIKEHLNQTVIIGSTIVAKTTHPYDPSLEAKILKEEKNLLFEAYEIIQIIRFRLTS